MQPGVGEREDGQTSNPFRRLDEVGEGEESLLGQRLAV